MSKGKTKDTAREEVELQLTSMIDVTFLLLIFFLCSIKFKMMDGKLTSYLPQDKGAIHVNDILHLEPLRIGLIRDEGFDPGFKIFVNGKSLTGLNALYIKLKEYENKSSDLDVILQPGPGIEHGHVVAVLNECLRAGFTDFTFTAWKD